MMTATHLKSYTNRLVINDAGQVVGSEPSADPGVVLDRLAREYSADHCCDYVEALERCMVDPRHADLVAEYAQRQPAPIDTAKLYAQHDEPQSHSYVGRELDAAAQVVMRNFGEKDYSAAFDIALELNPGLAKAYSEVQ